MSVQKIITVPNPLLSEKSKPVGKINAKVKKIVTDLIDTAKASSEIKGVGLSAIQITQPKRVFVVKQEKKFIPFINPQITWQDKKMLSQTREKDQLLLEGCLSIPGYFGFVDRPYAIKLKWLDLKGKEQEKKFKDKQAIFIQHELDHLNGLLFVQRVLKQKGKIFKIERNIEGKESLVEIELPWNQK